MNQPTPWAPKDPMEQRVSHEDRDHTAELLRVAAGDGRLSLEELDERLEECFAARTYADLARLVADLPAQPGLQPQPLPMRQEQRKELVRIERVGGNVTYEGAWLVPKRLELNVRGGNVRLDFTAAALAGPLTELDVELRGGNVRLTVPDGYAVDADEVAFRGGSVKDRRAGEAPAGGPVVHRIVVTGSITGGNLVVSGPRQPRRGLFRRRKALPGRGV